MCVCGALLLVRFPPICWWTSSGHDKDLLQAAAVDFLRLSMEAMSLSAATEY